MKNLFAIILIIASIGVFYYIVSPTYAEIQTLRVKKAGYDEALNHSQEAQGLRDTLETKFNNIPVSNLQRLEAFLPNSIDNIRLIIEIDKVAGRYNMSLSNAKVSLVKGSSAEPAAEGIYQSAVDYGTGKLDFSVKGTYENYLAFLRDLESSLRLINVTSISLSAGDVQKSIAEVDIYSYQTSLDTYWLKQ